MTRKEKDLLTNVIIMAGQTYGIKYSTAPRQAVLGSPRDCANSGRRFAAKQPIGCLSKPPPCVELRCGVVCGIRPGSLGTAKGARKGKKFPKWSDVTITRGTRPGNFNVLFKFRMLKGRNSEEDMREEVSLDFTINSPQSSDHLSISPAHRMLAISLRRDILEDHDSLESLIEGREYYI